MDLCNIDIIVSIETIYRTILKRTSRFLFLFPSFETLNPNSISTITYDRKLNYTNFLKKR